MVRCDLLDMGIPELWFVGFGTEIPCLQEGDSDGFKP